MEHGKHKKEMPGGKHMMPEMHARGGKKSAPKRKRGKK